MTSQLLDLREKPPSRYMIAGWRRQWSDGGEISGGLPKYLIDKLGARRIGEMTDHVSMMCYPFQVAGTHDVFRPAVAYQDGLPSKQMSRDNGFYDAGDGLVIFLGEEPWFHIDIYGQAFMEAISQLKVKRTVSVEGYNGPTPPELERTVNCVYSKPHMKQDLERYGLGFSSYGSERRSGPTIGMALVTLAHYQYQEIEMFRVGAMAPMYPFMTRGNEQVGISSDHRAFYDIMRRLKAMFGVNLDLTELKELGEGESRRLQETLERIGATDPNARQIIDRAISDYRPTPFEEPVELDPALDKTLEEIIKNLPEEPEQR